MTITNHNKLTSQEWGVLYDSLKTIKNPDTNVLRQFLEAPYKKVFTQADSEQYHYNYIKALQLKLETLTKEPTPIEKTMTRSQLYLTNNPLWTNELTAEEADAILKHTVGTCTLTEDEFNDRYSKAITGELTKKPFVLNFWQ